MLNDSGWMQVLSKVLRPAFGLALFLSQFTATRDTLFTESGALLGLGVVLIGAGVGLCVSASRHLQRAKSQDIFAQTGPYQVVRHPIYASIYLFSLGLGFLFFAWAWFGVLLVFAPLWVIECQAEEREMERIHGPAYRTYQQRTGMFFPKVQLK